MKAGPFVPGELELTKHGGQNQTKGNLEHIPLKGKVNEFMYDSPGVTAALVEEVAILLRVIRESRHLLGALEVESGFGNSFEHDTVCIRYYRSRNNTEIKENVP